MDRNQITGLLLMAAFIMGFFYFFGPDPPEQPASNSTTTLPGSTSLKALADTVYSEQQGAMNDSLKNVQLQQQYGILAMSAEGEEKEVVVENKNIKVVLSTLGGRIKQVELKDYVTYDHKPLILLDKESSHIQNIVYLNNKEIDLAELYFETSATDVTISENDSVRIEFVLAANADQAVIQTYTFGGKGYQISYDIEFRGMGKMISKEMSFVWENHLKRLEKDLFGSRNKTTINYYTRSGSFDRLAEASTEKEEEKIDEPLHWLAMKQKFFTSAIIGSHGVNLNEAHIITDYEESDTLVVKRALAQVMVNTTDLNASNQDFVFYFGPNNYQVLKKVTDGFSKNIYLGWPGVNLVNKYLIIPIFNFLDSFIGNYGIIIIILVLIVKILLFPLSYRSYVSMAKMKVLKPELDEMKEKLGGDMQKIQKEQMNLYRKAGVNPLSGCIPVILQMPILFSMFYFFPNSIELRLEPFLWADDLSTYDAIINLPFTIPVYGSHVSLFTLLMTLSTILYTWSNNQVSTVQGPMKMISYMMPVVFMVVLNKFPAGLSFYYFVSNLITFGQQALIRRFVDEDKLKAIIAENKKKNANKKKSKFQLRLDEAMKASREKQNERKKGKK